MVAGMPAKTLLIAAGVIVVLGVFLIVLRSPSNTEEHPAVPGPATREELKRERLGKERVAKDALPKAEAGLSPFSDEQTSYSRASEIEDVSYAGVKRVSRRIVVPLGRTRNQLTATLERAARELAKETSANAVMVFAYRPQDNLESTYSAGRAVYAPNGRWEEASSSAPMKVSVDLNDLYFAAPRRSIAVGETVRLKGPQDGLIDLSKEYGSWMGKDILARVPAGTEAMVLEDRAEQMGDQEFIRYRVRVSDNGVDVIGWVHQWDVEQDNVAQESANGLNTSAHPQSNYEGVTCDRFEARAQLQDDTLSFRLETDLPNTADIMVSVSRSYFEKGNPGTAYSRDYFARKSKVGASRNGFTCSVADAVFTTSLQEQMDKMSSIGMPFEVASIVDEIEVSFVLPISQSDPAFGERNANLHGRMAPVSGLKTIRAEKLLHRPLNRADSEMPRARTASHDTLEIGSSYRISRETPLMPAFEPSDPLAAIARKVSLPASTTILIREKKDKRGTPWYRADAYGLGGEHIGEGWINSGALMGQTITKSE